MKALLKRVAAAAFALAAYGFVAPSIDAVAEGRTVKLAIHVNSGEKGVMSMALNNAENVMKYYKDKGDKAIVRVVAYGPGLKMLLKGMSPVEKRIEKMSLESSDISFAACGNTHRKMTKKMGKKLVILDEAKMVTAGVVELMELQMSGYSYLRP